MAAEKTTMTVTIVASDRPVWSGLAASVTIPASEGGMGILPNHEPVLVVVNSGRVVVTDAEGARHGFDVEDGFVAFDSNKLTVAVEHCSDEVSADEVTA